MTERSSKSGGDLFIVDNSDSEWKVAQYLRDWSDLAHQIDIAAGYFEIGALLMLDGAWQKLDKIRILMGDEVSRRTHDAFAAALTTITSRLDDSIEHEKQENDFLIGVPAIVEALRTGKIEARVYRREKFHAKAYITHARSRVVPTTALVGSSNFTSPGLSQNVELNIQITAKVDELQAWYERHWDAAEDVTSELLRVVERHTRDYAPFDVYARAMTAYFRAHALSVGEWEREQSRMYPVLDQYQREGYHALMQIAARYNGALLCDGVGLGKTFIGLMLIERLLFERRNVALFVPKAARADVWEAKIDRFLPDARGRFNTLAIYNHTDLLRGGDYPLYIEEVAQKADAIIVDEAHHFRNIDSRRSRRFFEITSGKQLFLLTATPINNSLIDLLHLIEYFSRGEPGYFSSAPLGIHTLRGHFRNLEKALKDKLYEVPPSRHPADEGQAIAEDRAGVDPVAVDQMLAGDRLFQALVVQRSRAYVRESLAAQPDGRTIIFPKRRDPKVAHYSMRDTYGDLLDQVEKAFDHDPPLLVLAIYYPDNYRKKPIDLEKLSQDARIDAQFSSGRQAQIVRLVRTLLLKRFESSPAAFEATCEYLLRKLLYFVDVHNARTARQWRARHADLVARVEANLIARLGISPDGDEDDLDDDLIPAEFRDTVIALEARTTKIDAMVIDTLGDLDTLAGFLTALSGFDAAHDDKLRSLIHLMTTDPILSEHKVLIFTEYRDTADYLALHLRAAGVDGIAQADSRTGGGISTIVRRFAPYYNESSSAALAADGEPETRVLIATDILAEGLNLQDAVAIINYDLHWNPVRLMQRIGRVDRRLDPETEARLTHDHPAESPTRGTVWLWNFLPPAELNRLLSLYKRVTDKTLLISETFGIEGKKLLTPDDDYNALREFNQAYEGVTTSAEELYLTYQRLLRDHPDLIAHADALPLRVFSGREIVSGGARGVFFCYRLPAKDASGAWSDSAAFTQWYYYNLDDGTIESDPARIHPLIESTPDTPRRTREQQSSLSELRRKMDKHIVNTYLKQMQAPAGITGVLLAWMELS